MTIRYPLLHSDCLFLAQRLLFSGHVTCGCRRTKRIFVVWRAASGGVLLFRRGKVRLRACWARIASLILDGRGSFCLCVFALQGSWGGMGGGGRSRRLATRGYRTWRTDFLSRNHGTERLPFCFSKRCLPAEDRTHTRYLFEARAVRTTVTAHGKGRGATTSGPAPAQFGQCGAVSCSLPPVASLDEAADEEQETASHRSGRVGGQG